MRQLGKAAAVLLFSWFGVGLGACALQTSSVRSALIQSPDLHRLHPANIAVLPVEDRTGNKSVAALLPFMRDELNRSLPYRRYSPMAVSWVDSSLRDSAPARGASLVEEAVLKDLAGKVGQDADALLAVRINHWDDSSLLASAIVRFSAEVTLLGTKERKALWSGDLQGQVKAGGATPAPLDPADRARAAAAEFVAQLMQRLPRRRVPDQ